MVALQLEHRDQPALAQRLRVCMQQRRLAGSKFHLRAAREPAPFGEGRKQRRQALLTVDDLRNQAERLRD